MMQRLRSRSDDEGIAMIMVMAVVGIVIVLGLAMASYVNATSNASGGARQRLSSIDAAEAGIDNTYAYIQASGTSLPCSTNTTPLTGSVNDSPDVGSYSVTIKYVYSDGSTGWCPSTDGKTLSYALVTSVGNVTHQVAQTLTAQRTMVSEVTLTPVYGNGFTDAIYSNGTASFSNKTTLSGNSGNDANIYTNSTFNCSNNESFAGSVYAQGGISMSNSCSIAGNAWAKGSITAQTVGGFAYSSTGNITWNGGTSVGGVLQAAGTITPSCATNKCYPGSTGVPAPPTQPFPIMWLSGATAANWSGYTVYADNNCGTVKDDIVNTYSQKGSPTLVTTTCSVDFSKDHTISLKNNLAIYAMGGFSSSNLVSFDTNDGSTTRDMYWIVPYDEKPSCGSSGDGGSIQTDQNFSTSNYVDMFVYSPCAISFSNSSTHLGQIYGNSTVTVNNQFNMDFRPVPVPQSAIDQSSLPTVSYNVGIVYTRENRN